VTFKVGDLVEWTSQAAGITRTKRGEIVEVIAAYKRVNFGGYIRRSTRDHESYVVKANGRRYWPRVAHLKAAVHEVPYKGAVNFFPRGAK
jgi:hypothetical protein